MTGPSAKPPILAWMARLAFEQLNRFIDKRIKERCDERIDTDEKAERDRGNRR